MQCLVGTSSQLLAATYLKDHIVTTSWYKNMDRWSPAGKLWLASVLSGLFSVDDSVFQMMDFAFKMMDFGRGWCCPAPCRWGSHKDHIVIRITL